MAHKLTKDFVNKAGAGYHFDTLVRESVAEGMDEAEARRRARRSWWRNWRFP